MHGVKYGSYTTVTAVYHSSPKTPTDWYFMHVATSYVFVWMYSHPPHKHTQIHTHLIFTLAYLPSVPHIDEGAHGLEGTSATGQEVGAVVGLQEADKVGTLRLQNTDTHTG